MSRLYSLAADTTNLTDVQAKILDHLQGALPFASEIAKSQAYIIARGRSSSVAIVLRAVKPSYLKGALVFREGEAVLGEEFPFVENVFITRAKVVGQKMLDSGRQVVVSAYPIADNAGVPFAALAFLSFSTKQQQVLTDTAHLLVQVPLEGEQYYSIRPQDGVIILDASGRIMYANDMADDLYFVLDKEAADLKDISGHAIIRIPLVDAVMKSGQPAYGDRVTDRITLAAWALPVISGGKTVRVILVITDVTDVREKERQILVKESVIKEIHHRVKNSLNTVAGMLRMQSRRTSDEDTRQALKKAVNRIMGISQIHDMLASQSGDEVDLDILLDRLCRLSVDSLSSCPVEIKRKRNAAPLVIPSETAVSLSIAANELIHNAISHGFRGRPSGTLLAEAKRKGDMLEILIRNDGNRLPDGFSASDWDLGLQIVKNVVEIELKGNFHMEGKGGIVSARIQCPLADKGV
ncbi:MAG: histidine kinase N-terminal domain-containing protein [Dialister sp.]|nr:histidine kinase N-terminal domain-containing protein [Dialister sp.]